MRTRLKKKLEAKKKAKEDIPKLLLSSKRAYKDKDLRLSGVYSKKIKYLHMKHKIKLPKETRRQLCKHCFSVLIPGVSCRVRITGGKVVYYCLGCKRYIRIPLR